MKNIKYGVLLFMCLFLLVGCKGDISSQALTDFKDYSAYFEGVDGCFVLYQNKLNKYWMYNGGDCFLNESPDSTYEIYHSLIGLELGYLPSDLEMGLWDKKDYACQLWNQDQTFESAFEASVVWYFKKLARQIDPEVLQGYIDDVNYGNKDLSGPKDSYWLESSLKITPVQQVELLRKLYIKVLPFSTENQQLVKDLMFLGQYGDGKLYGKNGSDNGKKGWFVGFVEKESTAYFFATHIFGETGITSEQAREITIKILRSEELLGD